MDEVIFFRRPSDASHFLLFNLPHPPHPLAVDEESLTQLCSQHGLLFQCSIHSAAKDDSGDPPLQHRSEDGGQQLHATPSYAAPHPTSSDSLSASLPFLTHPPAAAEAAEPSLPQWAHVHYFSVSDARAAMQALRVHFCGSDVRSVWSRRRQGADEEGSIACAAPRFWPISFATSLQVINHFLGPLRWTCEIKWTSRSAAEQRHSPRSPLLPHHLPVDVSRPLRYDPVEHGHIIAGQTEGIHPHCCIARSAFTVPALSCPSVVICCVQSRLRRTSWMRSASCSG